MRVYDKTISTEVLWVVAGQVLSFVATLVSVKVLTKILPADAYGELALALSIAGIINLFLYGPLSQAVLRYYAISVERQQLWPYIGVVRKLGMLVSFILIGVALLATLIVWLAAGNFWSTWIGIAFIFGLISGLFSLPLTILSAMRDRRAVALLQIIDAWARVAFSVLFLSVFGPDSRAALGGYVFGGLIVLVASLRIAKYRLSFDADQTKLGNSNHQIVVQEIVKFALPFIGFAAFASASQFGDRWILQGVMGASEVGLYAVLLQIASMPSISLYSLMSSVLAPIIFVRVGDDPKGSRLQSVRRLIVVSSVGYFVLILMGAVFLAFWADELIMLVSTVEYSGHAATFLVLYFSSAIFMLGQFLALVGLAKNNPKEILLPKCVQGVLALVIGGFLVSSQGAFGVALASFFASAVYALLMLRLAIRSFSRV